MQIKTFILHFLYFQNRPQRNFFLLFSLALSSGMMSCIHRVDIVSIEGTLDYYPKTQVYFNRFDGDSLQIIDSAKTNSKGEFILGFDCKAPMVVSVGLNKNQPLIILVVEPDQEVILDAREPDIRNYKVHGSQGSSIMYDLSARIKKTRSKIDSLNSVYKISLDLPGIDSIQNRRDSILNLIITKHKNYTRGIIRNNPYSLAAVLALFQSYDSLHPVLDYSEDSEIFQNVDKSLNSVYSSNSLVKNFHSRVIKLDSLYKLRKQRELMFKEGMVLPDAPFTLLSGENLYVSGIWFRYILIDFWAIWCKECNDNTENLRNIYKEFAPKGLVILQVSVDSNIDSLKSTILRDTLSWYHSSVQWDDKLKLLDTLNISSIPANYITDRRGNIKAVNLYGDNLKLKLKELLP